MCEQTERILQEYSLRTLDKIDDTWVLRPSRLGGRGLFTTKDLQPGDTIFRCKPLVLGPHPNVTEPVCSSCHKPGRIVNCPQGCCLPVCSHACASAITHVQECRLVKKLICLPHWRLDLVGTVTALRFLLLGPEDREVIHCLQTHENKTHNFEVELLKRHSQGRLKKVDEEWLQQYCRVMDINAFELVKGCILRGLYPVAAMLNHSCSPNSCHVYNGEAVMRVFAATALKAGDEVTTTYSALLWPTTARRLGLQRNKHFLCRCSRCQDPTEFGSFLSELPCQCKGQLLPTKPLKPLSPWTCTSCGIQVSSQAAVKLQTAQGTLLQQLGTTDPETMASFLKDPPPGHQQVIVQLQNSLVWCLGHKPGYTWEELSHEMLTLKEQNCRSLLQVLNTLRVGFCRMKGLVMMELQRTLSERIRRDQLVGKSEEEIKTECSTIIATSKLILQDEADV